MAEIMKKYNSMPLPMAITRENPIALDTTALWYDYEALVAYAASGATAYVGQLVVHVDEAANKATAYIIQNDGTLQEVGSGAQAQITADEKSITNNEGVIGLYNYGKQYYKYIPATGSEENGDYVAASYELTEGWIAGLEPRVVEVEGKMVLGWYQPSDQTVEGLNSTVGSLSTRVEDLSTDVADLNTIINGSGEGATQQVVGLVERVTGLENSVGNLETTIQGLTSAFVFKGQVDTEEALQTVANPQNGWVYKVGNAEFVYDGENWVELGTVYSVDLSDYVTQSNLNTKLSDYATLTTTNSLDERIDDLEAKFIENGTVAQLEAEVDALADVVGDETTGLVQQVTSLEQLLGAPANGDTAATGLYKVVGDLTYVAKIVVGDTEYTPDENRAITLPVFDGNVAGLVPVNGELAEDELGTYFLNADGAWAIPADSRIGSLTYNEQTYSTVEEYIAAYVAANEATLVWEPIV